MDKNTLGDNNNFFNTFYPTNKTELRELIKKFNSSKESYFAISTGNNWGYGCNSANTKAQHCIQLSKMNQIIDFDNKKGLITLQPGVTYGQVSKFLSDRGDQWITPVHGGGVNCSIIGNTLERGYGLTPTTDHFQACQSLEAILPNGLTYQSPFQSMKLDKLGKLFRNGIGPYLDGIFTQSNFGIVTEMTVKLAPKSDAIELFFVNIKEDELKNAVKVIQKLKKELKNTIGGINLMNKERILSMLIDYPESLIKNRKPLSSEFIAEKAKEYITTDWTIVGSLYGDKKIVKAVKNIIKKELREITGRKIFLSQNKIRFLNRITNYIPRLFNIELKSNVDTLGEFLNILNGVPQDTALKLAYWKNLNKNIPDSNLNPNRDNCGLIWYAPLVEMTPNHVSNYVKFVNRVSEKYEINPLITLTTIDDLCFDSTIPILFNRDDELDQSRAHEYFNALLNEGKALGFFPYRLGTNSMQSFLNGIDSDYSKILASLKNAFDEEGLYAAGRYVPPTKNDSTRNEKIND
jgi:hypothetical protein